MFLDTKKFIYKYNEQRIEIQVSLSIFLLCSQLVLVIFHLYVKYVLYFVRSLIIPSPRLFLLFLLDTFLF